VAPRPDIANPQPRAQFGHRAWLAIAGLVIVTALACSRESKTTAVAKVGDETLTAEDVADYMVRTGRGTNKEDVRKAVDQLIDLHLLKQRAKANHHLTPAESLQVNEWNEIQLLNQFREDVVWKDVKVDEQKLRDWYDKNVGEEVKARHILISVPPGATEAQKADARKEADSLRQAIVDGKVDFGAAAREHSDDQGSATRGGQLDWFSHGRMVPAFEKAAFETPVGQISPVVETQFGYHIIKVEDKRKQSFDELRDSIEDEVALPERQEAEQNYVTKMMENSAVEFHESNIDRFIARVKESNPAPLTDDQAKLPLATFDGGEITFGELWSIYDVLPEANKHAIAQLDQEGLVRALSPLVQQRLLVKRAKTANVAIDTTRQRELDERIDQLYMESYARDAAQSRFDISDSAAQEYYDQHREFYQGKPFAEVADQIKQQLAGQRMQAMNDPDAQRDLVKAIADSQRQKVEISRNDDAYDEVLKLVRQKYEEKGTEPAESEAGNRSATGDTTR